MPDPARLLTTLQRAIQAFHDTPGRRGRVVSLDGAGDVLVGGDLHGSVENFRLLLQRAEFARLDARLQRRQLVAAAPAAEHPIALFGEARGDGGADEITGPDHGDGGVPRGGHVLPFRMTS